MGGYGYGGSDSYDSQGQDRTEPFFRTVWFGSTFSRKKFCRTCIFKHEKSESSQKPQAFENKRKNKMTVSPPTRNPHI